ncbi:MAG: hypothetical protein LBW85_08480 [Deltaproteobacteria bacterium]|jgi:hypothetical protein|nr:hypothetical protein [Deltaproteobacteria bacterium]
MREDIDRDSRGYSLTPECRKYIENSPRGGAYFTGPPFPLRDGPSFAVPPLPPPGQDTGRLAALEARMAALKAVFSSRAG